MSRRNPAPFKIFVQLALVDDRLDSSAVLREIGVSGALRIEGRPVTGSSEMTGGMGWASAAGDSVATAV